MNLKGVEATNMACEPSTLLNGTECFLCLTPDMIQAIRIRLLCAIRDHETMSCDPQTLVSEANCILSCMLPHQMKAAEILLLCNLASASSSSGAVLCGHGAPVADPGVSCAIYYDLDQGDVYKWRDSTGDWSA